MVTVLASTTAVPELSDGLARRRADGRHGGDGWRDGVLLLADPSRPEQGEVVARLTGYLLPLADALGLCLAVGATIGQPGRESLVPAITVFDGGSPRTTPASLSTAELVVDVIDRGAPGGDRMGFYARWRVREVLTIDLDHRSLALHRSGTDGWEADGHSQILGFEVEADALTSLRGHERMVWPAT